MSHQKTDEPLAAQLREHLFNHILPFWCGPALDHKQGGWMAWLSNDLTPDRTKPKGLIVHSRILWTFSAVHRVKPDTLHREMAERAFDFLASRFWDAQHGGAFWQLNDSGRVIDDSKKIYGQAFFIYAMSEFYRAFGSQSALRYALELFELIENHAHDPVHGGFFEVRRRDWSEAGPEARLSEKDMNEKKSMNNQLHVLEACTNLYRVSRSAAVETRLRELIDIFLHRIMDAHSYHLNHFFDEKWTVRSDTYTFGHDIEASWLLCEAAEELRDHALRQTTRSVALQIAEVVLNEGIDADGGLRYEGKAGRIVDPGKECWPQAEAMIGFVHAFQLSGEERYLKAAQRVWDYCASHLVDRVHGEWFWRINPDGRPDANLPKVSEWKGPYHVTRACLEVIENRIWCLKPSHS